jgi:glutaredoxin-like protein NrdH
MQTTHVPGKNAGRITVYALSTCPWCKKVKALLNEKGVEYDFVDVDLLLGEDRTSAMKTVEKWNPNCSFPTMVVNDQECIVGFDEEKIKKALKL